MEQHLDEAGSGSGAGSRDTMNRIRRVFIESLHLNLREEDFSYERKLDESVGLDSVAVLDEEGRLLGDVSAFDLLVSDGDRRLRDLIGTGDPLMTLRPEDDLDTVATELVESRRSSLLVVDAGGRPLGRILSDDVLDALVPGHGRLHFPRLLQ